MDGELGTATAWLPSCQRTWAPLAFEREPRETSADAIAELINTAKSCAKDLATMSDADAAGELVAELEDIGAAEEDADVASLCRRLSVACTALTGVDFPMSATGAEAAINDMECALAAELSTQAALEALSRQLEAAESAAEPSDAGAEEAVASDAEESAGEAVSAAAAAAAATAQRAAGSAAAEEEAEVAAAAAVLAAEQQRLRAVSDALHMVASPSPAVNSGDPPSPLRVHHVALSVQSDGPAAVLAAPTASAAVPSDALPAFAAATAALHSHWAERNDEARELARWQQRRESLQLQRRLAEENLASLQRTNLLNDALFVWHDGPFATVNGQRLGKLPVVQVEWTEINAALGQAALLVAAMAAQAGFTFSTYRIIPMGSFSKLARVGDERTTLELNWDGSIFRRRGFNTALGCFVECVHELAEHAAKEDPTVQLPYRIEGHKIDGVSAQLSSDLPAWTRAMKMLLTDIKWLLSWCSR